MKREVRWQNFLHLISASQDANFCRYCLDSGILACWDTCPLCSNSLNLMSVVGLTEVQIFEIESEPGPFEIQYDEEWLAITRKFNSILPLTTRRANFGFVYSWHVSVWLSVSVTAMLSLFPFVAGVYSLTCKNVANGLTIGYRQEGLNLLSLCRQFRATIPLVLFQMCLLWVMLWVAFVMLSFVLVMMGYMSLGPLKIVLTLGHT